jgi:hypothetical protein
MTVFPLAAGVIAPGMTQKQQVGRIIASPPMAADWQGSPATAFDFPVALGYKTDSDVAERGPAG